MKITIAQITSLADLNSNLSKMESILSQAKAQGTEVVIFPEMAYFSGHKEENAAVALRYSELLNHFCHLAQRTGVALVPGTLREPSDTPGKFYNTLPFIDPSGKILATYRKIFLYQATLPERTYDETRYSKAGQNIMTLSWRELTFGFAICFDIRFPELFRSLKKRGAQLILLPSAFTVPTGQAHWEILLRARAIENQFFIAAPGLTGLSGDGAPKYGHSMTINPWGDVLTNLKSGESFETIEIDPSQITAAQSKVPSWNCRRDELFTVS